VAFGLEFTAALRHFNVGMRFSTIQSIRRVAHIIRQVAQNQKCSYIVRNYYEYLRAGLAMLIVTTSSHSTGIPN